MKKGTDFGSNAAAIPVSPGQYSSKTGWIGNATPGATGLKSQTKQKEASSHLEY